MATEIRIVPGNSSAEEVYRGLHEQLAATGVELRLDAPGARTRAVLETAVLVAVVAGSSGAFSALITGLLKLLEKRREQKVVVRGQDGRSVEFPAGTPLAEQQRLIEMARALDRPHIEIVP